MSKEEKKRILLTCKEILMLIKAEEFSKQEEKTVGYVKKKVLTRKLYGKDIQVGWGI